MNIVQALLSVSQSGPDEFTSDHAPRAFGNPPPIAYGGCTIGAAILSACQTVSSPKFHIYSVLGSFHGLTRNDRSMICRVTRTRDTRTFATRRVMVCQKQDDGQDRNCAEVFIDFHILEDELMKYSAPPTREYGDGPEDDNAVLPAREILARLVQRDQLPSSTDAFFTWAFKLMEDFYETRPCLAGVSGQNLYGLATHLKTSQDALAITERTSAEWIRLRQPVDGEAENTAALSFNMDSALSTLPLVFNNQNQTDPNVAACSTLDFALRIMVPGSVQLHKWHLKELKTIGAAAGRTYSEARLWDEEGNLVAVETQASILRPRKPSAASSSKSKI